MSAIVTRPPKLHIDDELIIGNDTGPKVETARIGLSGGIQVRRSQSSPRENNILRRYVCVDQTAGNA